jgi:hypothetical protein
MKSNLTGFYVGGRFLANSSHANATHLSGKTEGNLNVNNATTAYSKTEGNLNVNNALTANNSTNLGGIAASSYYRSGSTDVALADGGTNASLTASAGAIAFSNATGIALTAVGTSGQVLTSAAAGTPTWTSQSSLAAGTATTATNQSGGTVAATTGSFTGRVIGTGALASGTMLTATGALGAFEAQTVSGANAAFMSFHRAGLYASYFGLDTDNQFAVGGWSAGAALANMKVGSLGVGGAASGTAGSITATGSISAASLAGSIATGNGASGTWNITANNATNLGGTAAANYDKFPSGTRLVFHQTAAPTGWTKDTTHDNKALRVVSGTVGSGGTVAFTTAFASQSVTGTVGNYTLLTNDIPSHTHFIAADIVSGGTAVANATAQVARSRDISTNSPNYILNSTTTAATVGLSSASGGGTAHNHSFTGTAINMAVQYVDIILAQKN